MANVHPYFANQSIDHAAEWVSTFFEAVNVAQAASTTRKPEAFIAETGWPTVSFGAIPTIVLLPDGIQITGFHRCSLRQ
jgi:exo-beta-1,3-glucanase (GH17 family)